MTEKATVGYTGGHAENPSYDEACAHGTRHAEAVEVEFDPDRVSYDGLSTSFGRSTIRRRSTAGAGTSATSTARRSSSTARSRRLSRPRHVSGSSSGTGSRSRRRSPQPRRSGRPRSTTSAYLEKRSRATCAVGVPDAEPAQPSLVARLLGR